MSEDFEIKRVIGKNNVSKEETKTPEDFKQKKPEITAPKIKTKSLDEDLEDSISNFIKNERSTNPYLKSLVPYTIAVLGILFMFNSMIVSCTKEETKTNTPPPVVQDVEKQPEEIYEAPKEQEEPEIQEFQAEETYNEPKKHDNVRQELKEYTNIEPAKKPAPETKPVPETLSLEEKILKYKFKAYDKIQRNWTNVGLGNYDVIGDIVITNNGKSAYFTLNKQSGDEKIKNEVVNALYRSLPFDNFPEGYQESEIRFEIYSYGDSITLRNSY